MPSRQTRAEAGAPRLLLAALPQGGRALAAMQRLLQAAGRNGEAVPKERPCPRANFLSGGVEGAGA